MHGTQSNLVDTRRKEGLEERPKPLVHVENGEGSQLSAKTDELLERVNGPLTGSVQKVAHPA